MKPEPRRSPGCDPCEHKNLSVRMKPPPKKKSPDVPSMRSMRAPHHLTSTTNKIVNVVATKSRNGQKTENEKFSGDSGNISGISPIKSTRSQEYISSRQVFKSPTPRIVISASAKSYIDTAFKVNQDVGGLKVPPNSSSRNASPKSKKTVLRGKVKSPVNPRLIPKSHAGGKVNDKEVGAKPKEFMRSKVEELEGQLKKKDSEIICLNRKMNLVQKSLADKEKNIKDLERRLPKMLNEFKKGLDEDENKKKINKNLKESIKRNRNLSGNMKQIEDQLKFKEDKLQEVIASKKHALDQLKSIEKESKECFHRLVSAEKKTLELQTKLEEREDDLSGEKEKNGYLEHRLKIQAEENFEKIKLIESLETDLSTFTRAIFEKDCELAHLKEQNADMKAELEEQYRNLDRTEMEIKQYIEVIENIKQKMADSNNHDIQRKSVDIDQATEDFLDKVSAVSKDKNVTVNLKLTVRKSRLDSTLDQSHVFRNHMQTPFNNNNTGSFSANVQKELFANVFTPPNVHLEDENEEEMSVDDYDEVFDLDDMTNSSDESSNFTVSSETYERVEALGSGVQQLWERLSGRSECEVGCEQVQQFSDSVGKLQEDLDQSIQHHNRFMEQVSVAKKLFL